MCGLYTREINLKPYFLYSQHRQTGLGRRLVESAWVEGRSSQPGLKVGRVDLDRNSTKTTLMEFQLSQLCQKVGRVG